MHWLAAPIGNVIRLSSPVWSVEWQPGHVSIAAQRAGRATHITARAAIVTVPLGVLHAPDHATGAIRFVPDLPQKRDALAKLAVGSALRVVIQFRDRFWTTDQFARRHEADELHTLSFLHGREQDFPTWWTTYPVVTPILVG